MGNNYQFILYDLAKKTILKKWSLQEYISGVTFSPDGRYLALGLYTGPVYILRLAEPPAASSR